MSQNLFDKVWDLHKVRTLESGQDQLFIGLHLLHEVTSPQAFGMLRERGLKVLHPERTFATVDHIVPTKSQLRPFSDALAEGMIAEIERNTKDHNIQFFGLDSDFQGVVHIVGPELGLTQPGMTIACGDSHTATHGAFGAIAFGIGTSQIRDILSTQTMALIRPKVRKIEINGKLAKGVTAKDIILRVIADLGVNGGIGYAYEYSGDTISALSMEERMTICNMSIEGGARCGYINPDQKTFEYLQGRPFAPQGPDFDKALLFWKSIASASDAHYDDVWCLDAATITPMVSWGINPGQSINIDAHVPRLSELAIADQDVAREAFAYMGLEEGQALQGIKIDVAFIGSCTNGRLSDLQEAARVIKGHKVKKGVRAIVVPGSRQVAKQAVEEGLDQIFTDSGFEWRAAGCSMCLAMNPDKLVGAEVCASSSNRNFKGRQGSPSGRTLLMSPAMVAAAAVLGVVTDIRHFN